MWITQKQTWLILMAILLAGVFLRFYTLSVQPYWMDEGFTINSVSSGLNCSFYCKSVMLSTKIFSENAFGFRFPSAIAGSVLVFIVFLFSRQVFNIKVALWASFFTALSYFEIAWSRQARAYTLWSLFVWLDLWFFAQYFYGLKNRKKWLGLALATAVAGLILILRKVSGWEFSFNFWLLNYAEFYLKEYWFFAALFIGALIFARRHLTRYKKEISTLIALAGIYTLAVAVLSPIPQYRYLFHLLPAIFILGGISIFALQEKIKTNWLKNVSALIIVAIFLFTTGTMLTQKEYSLESDNILGRPKDYYAYVPQPDWNSAYAFIKENKRPEDAVISSLSVFNKIFLNEPGYWLVYPYLGFEDARKYMANGLDYYAGAKTIQSVEELKEITGSIHGFIIFDFMATHGRIKPEILDYIYSNLKQVYHQETNPHSQIWIYQF